jgi:hypothetical protein
MTLNLIYSIWILRKQQIWVYRLLYDQFAAELNLQLKPQANDIKISPNLIYDAISPPIHRIWSCNWFWGDLHNNSLRVVFFCSRIEPRIKTSSKRYQNKPKFGIWCDLTPNIPYEVSNDYEVVCLWFTKSCVSAAKLNRPLNFN